MDIANVIKQVIKLFTGKSAPSANEIINKLTNPNQNQTSRPQTNTPPSQCAPCNQQSQTTHTEVDDNEPLYNYLNPTETRAYYRDILKAEFPQYELREDVPVTSVRGSETLVEEKFWKEMPRKHYKPEEGRPYDFGMYMGGELKAVVSLGYGSCHDMKKKYLVSRAYARKAGIPYINFYTQFANRKPYVVDRVRKNLGI